MGIPHSSSQDLTQQVLNDAVLCLRKGRSVFEYHYGEVSHALRHQGTEKYLTTKEYRQKQKQIDYLLAHELNGTWWFISSVYCWWYDIDLKDTQRYILGILDRLYHGRLQVDKLLPGERAFVRIFQSKSLAPLFVFMKSIFIKLEALQSFDELIRRTWAAFTGTKVSSPKPAVIQAGNKMQSLPERQPSTQPSKQTVWHGRAVQMVSEAVSESNERVSGCSREFNKHDWPATIVVSLDRAAYSTKAAYDASEKQIKSLLKRTEEQIIVCVPAGFSDLELLRQDWQKAERNIAHIIANVCLWKSTDYILDNFTKEQVKNHFKNLQAIVQDALALFLPLLRAHETTLRIIRLQNQIKKCPDLPDIHDKEGIKQYFGIQNASSKAALWQERYCSMNKMNTELHKLEETHLGEVIVGDVSGREAVEEVAEKLGRMQQSAQACAMSYMQVMFEETKETIRKAMTNDVESFELDMNQEIERFSVEVVCFSEEVCPGLNVKKAEYIKALEAFLREMHGRLLVLALLPTDDRVSRIEEYNTADKEKEEDEKHKPAFVAQELSAEIEAIQNGLSRFHEQLSEMDKVSLILNYAIRLLHFCSEKKALLDPNGLRKQKRLFEWLTEAGKDTEKSEWEKLDKTVLGAYKDLNAAFAQCIQKLTGKPPADISRLSQFIQQWNTSIDLGEVDGDIVFLRQFFNEKEEKLQSLEEKASSSTPATVQAPPFVARMTTWLSQALSTVTLPQRWNEIAREQEASHGAFLELLEKQVPEKQARKVVGYVQYFKERLEEYERAFEIRYKECGDIENATGLHLVAFKEQYIGYKKEIEQARQFLQGWDGPAGAVDAVDYETSTEEIRKRTNALFLKAAPDKNQNKGALVEKLTHLMMEFMLKQKKMLLTSNKEGDKLGVQPFYDRFNAIDDEVDALGVQCRAMAAALKKHELLGTEIVPVYDPERVNAIEREFYNHVYNKAEEGIISDHDAWLLTGRFTQYCSILNEVARIIISWMKNTLEMHEKIRIAGNTKKLKKK